MSDPRTVDCEVWARREIKRLTRTVRAQLVEIRPKPGYRVLGGIRLPPDNEIFWPSPAWHYHYAVLAGGLVRDEIYPNGLPMNEYRAKFEYEDAIVFTLHDQ
jgi:hypothetical protein